MNSETAETFGSAFLSHREAYGVAITINGQDIAAIVNESPFSRELMEGGFADDGDIEVKFLLSDLSAIPSLGTSAVYRSRNFRVSRVAIQPGSLIGEITCRPHKR